MDESKQEQADAQKTTDELLQERQSDATSDETIKKVEENRTSLDPSEESSGAALSPDGALDEGEEVKDAGPM